MRKLIALSARGQVISQVHDARDLVPGAGSNFHTW